MADATLCKAGPWRRAAAAGLRRLPVLLPAVAALSFAIPFCLHPLVVHWDQAHWLHAAERFAHGQGLTYPSLESVPELDPARPVYRPLTWWPPGYSLLVGIQRKAGVPLSAACKVPNVVFWLAGWFAWGVFFRRALPPGNPWGLVVLGLPLSFHFGFVQSGTDVVLWAVVPVWLLAVHAAGKAATTREAVASAALAGLLAGLAYWARYASLFLVPAGALCLVLFPARPAGRRAAPLLVFLGLSCLPIVALSLWNRMTAGTASAVIGHSDASYDLGRLYTLAPAVNLLPASLDLEHFLRSRHVRQTFPWLQGRILPACLALTCLGLALWHGFALRKGARPENGDFPRLLLIVLTVYVILTGMLAYLSYQYVQSRGTRETWTFIEETRYYMPLQLACLAVILTALLAREPSAEARWGIKLLKTGALLAILAAVLAEAAQGAAHSYRYWSQALASPPGLLRYDHADVPQVAQAIAEVRAQAAPSEGAVILSRCYPFFLVASDAPAYSLGGPRLSGPTSPTHVFVAVMDGDQEGYPEEYRAAMEFVDRYKLTPVRASELTSSKLYHKLLSVGELDAPTDR